MTDGRWLVEGLRHPARPSAVLAAAALTACCAGCSTPASSAPPSTAAPAAGPPAASAQPQDDDDQPATPSPAADDASLQQAAGAATRAVTAFTSHQGSPATWWRQLQPLLTPTAATDYAGTDPANVPGHHLTGPPALTPTGSGYLARAQVPTDAGIFDVLLVRTGQQAPWLVQHLQPPVTDAAAPTAPSHLAGRTP